MPISTSGRPSSSPNPYNGYPTGATYGLDKGHLMALSMGGSNINLNIIPQSSQWQQSGGWYQMEANVYNFAKFKYDWNTVSHASEIETIPKPNSCDVIFIVQPLIYNLSNGQPLSYNGSVSLVKNHIHLQYHHQVHLTTILWLFGILMLHQHLLQIMITKIV